MRSSLIGFANTKGKNERVDKDEGGKEKGAFEKAREVCSSSMFAEVFDEAGSFFPGGVVGDELANIVEPWGDECG